jgi:hypothetical protein
LKAGEILQAVEKCRGLKKGEKIVYLGKIRVTHVRREPLEAIASRGVAIKEVVDEGFPGMIAEEFVQMFCESHRGCEQNTIVTRIEFEYV